MNGSTLNSGCKQRGVALFTVLIFLISLTILALASMRGANLGERMARNGVDRALAMNAAEAALRDAENDLLCLMFDGTRTCDSGDNSARYRGAESRPLSTGIFQGTETCNLGECQAAEVVIKAGTVNTKTGKDKFMRGAEAWTTTRWDNAATFGQFTSAPSLPLVAKPPKYLIEQRLMNVGNDSKLVYAIYALGYGANENNQVMLQEIYYPK